MKRWIPAILIMVGIFYMSSRTSTELTSMFPFFDNLNWGHLVAYFVLSITYMWALVPKIEIRTSMVIAVLLSVLYGFTDEWHQMYVPGRAPDLYDILNDFIGATVGVLGYRYVLSSRKKQS